MNNKEECPNCFVGLDVSSSNIGYSIIDLKGYVRKYGVITSRDREFRRIKDKRLKIVEMTKVVIKQLESGLSCAHKARYTIELPVGRFKKQSAGDIVHFAIGAMTQELHHTGWSNIKFITPMKWKSWVVNNVLADKLTIQEKVEEITGVFLQDDNISDAIGIGYTSYQLYQAGIHDLYE